MPIQTKNSIETASNSKKYKHCLGMKQHHNQNLTGCRQNCGKIQSIYATEELKIWYDEIKLLVEQKNSAYKKYLLTKAIENEIEYKRRRATAKRENIKRHRKVWEQFMSHIEPDMYKIRPNTFNHLKTKRRLLYLKTQFVPRSKHFSSRL